MEVPCDLEPGLRHPALGLGIPPGLRLHGPGLVLGQEGAAVVGDRAKRYGCVA